MSELQQIEQGKFLCNPFRENFEESLSRSIGSKHGIDLQRRLKQKDSIRMQMLFDGVVDSEIFEGWIKNDGVKYICKTFFGSTMSELDAYRKALRSMRKDMEDYREENYYMSEEDGKLLHSSENADHTPPHPAHFNKGLGENAGFVARNKHGYVYQLFADGYLRKIDVFGVKKLLFERYEIIVSDNEASMIAEDLNTDRLVFLGKSLQGEIGDSPMVRDAVSAITTEGKTKGLSYENTYQKGIQVRQVCSKIEHEAGKIVGKAIVEGNSQELNSKTARMVFNLIQGTQQNVGNVLALVSKIANNIK